MKGLQNIDPTTASASSNHCSTAILHTTRGTIKHNMAVKISKLADGHKVHRRARYIENSRDRKSTDSKVANKGDRK